MKHSTNLSDNQ